MKCFLFASLVLLAGLCVHAGELSVAAIAGRPATVSDNGPALDVSAIATGVCRSPNCPLEAVHQCGAPGCDCSDCAARRSVAQLPALDMAAMSPRRAITVQAAKPALAPAVAAKAAPHYELRTICHGHFCTRQWVLVQ